MKIYTRTGDKGKTGILGKSRLDKDDIRIESYGTIDELNSILGMCTVKLEDEMIEDVRWIQRILFEMGTELAYEEYKELITESDVKRIESMIDNSEDKLPALSSFILPGGTELSTSFQFARAVCRRSERRLVSFSKVGKLNKHTLAFVNRLSDLLFSWSRLANIKHGEEEIIWKSRK